MGMGRRLVRLARGARARRFSEGVDLQAQGAQVPICQGPHHSSGTVRVVETYMSSDKSGKRDRITTSKASFLWREYRTSTASAASALALSPKMGTVTDHCEVLRICL